MQMFIKLKIVNTIQGQNTQLLTQKHILSLSLSLPLSLSLSLKLNNSQKLF